MSSGLGAVAGGLSGGVPAPAPAPSPAAAPAPRLSPGQASNNEALQRVLQIGLLGLGAGAGAGGLMGLRDLVMKRSPLPPERRLGGLRPAVIEVGQPDEEDEERDRKTRKAASLAAPAASLAAPAATPVAAPAATPAAMLNDPTNWTKLPPDYAKNNPDLVKNVGDVLGGEWTNNLMSKPWFMPAAVAAGGLGLYGGYKGVRHLLDAQHKKNRQADLEAAQKEYRDALVDQYTAGAKTAGDSLGTELDALASEKAGGIGQTVADTGGAALGGYLTLAGLLAAGAGVGTYAYTKSQSPESRLAKAIQQRERLRWAARPPEIYAVGRPKRPAPEPEPPPAEPETELSPTLKMGQSALGSLYRSAACP